MIVCMIGGMFSDGKTREYLAKHLLQMIIVKKVVEMVRKTFWRRHF